MVTSVEDLKKVGTVEKELPPFDDGTPFTAKLRKISVIDMARNGKIPNPLMKAFMNISGDKKEKTDNVNLEKELLEKDENMIKSFEFMMSVVENSLVSPTYKEIKDCGVMLTDQQIFAIFNFAFGDFSVLEKFC